MQAILAIVFESVIFQYHAEQISILDSENLDQKGFGDSLATAYANARSLLVYFVLFMIAQIFTVLLVVDAVSFHFVIKESRETNTLEFLDLPKEHN